MSNNLALRVTADIADAQAKLSVLNAEFRATQTQINALSRAGAAGNLDAAGAAQLQALTTRSLELQAAAQPLASTVREAGFAVKGLGTAAVSAGAEAASAGINVSSLTRYSRELFDEFSSGRTRYLPSTLAELANQGFHLKPAMLAGYGGVAILVAGLGYLAYKSIEAQNALKGISASAAFLGNVNVSPNVAGALVAQIKSSADVGEAEAEKTARAITSIQNLSGASMRAIAGNIGVVAQALGTTSDKAAGTVAKILDVNTSVQKLQDLLPGLTASQVQQAQASQQSGDYAQILTGRWQLLTSQLERMQQAQKKAIEQKLAFAESAAGQQDVAGKAELDNSYIYIHQLKEQQRQIERNIALTQQMGAHPLGPQAAQNQLKAALGIAEKLDQKNTERRALVAQIATLEHSILTANQSQRAVLEGGIAAASEKLAKLNTPHGGRVHQAAGGGESARLQSLRQVGDAHQREAEREIADDQRVLSQLLAVHGAEAESAQQVMQIRVQSADQALNAAVSAGRMSAAQRLAVEQSLTNALYTQDLKRLQNELATLPQGSIEYARVAGQIEVLKAREVEQLAGYDAQIRASATTSVTSQVSAWQLMANEVMRTEGNLVQNIVSGRRTLGGSLRAMGQELVAQEIMQDAQAVTARLLLHGKLTQEEKAMEQGGVLFHALTESQKTAITVTGETTRTAATEMAHLKRLALKEASEAKSLAITIAHALKRIGIDAAEAGAGAFKAMVGIPYVGPILAVAASAAAILEVKKLAHFEQGAWEIPGTMHAILHAGETVLPRPFAQDYRAAVSGAGGGIGGGGVHHHGDIVVADTDIKNMLESNNGRDALVGVIGQAIRNGNLR